MPNTPPPPDSLRVYIEGFAGLSAEQLKPGQRRLDHGELPFGSTLLVSGSPGAGKTTFSLALARSLMFDQARKFRQKAGPRWKLRADHERRNRSERILYYISSEINLERLAKMVEGFGWLKRLKNPAAANAAAAARANARPGRLFRFGDQNNPDSDTLYVITPEPMTDRPVPTPEELVNDIFNRISKSLSPSEAPEEKKQVIVIVDSITALLKGCASPSDERRQSHEILHRLRGFFGEHLALTILLAEQEEAGNDGTYKPSVEDYLAEVVFRLSHRALPLGRRSRVVEIVKSQGINLIPGDHTWAIVTKLHCPELFRHPAYVELVEKLGTLDFCDPSEDRDAKTYQPDGDWATIAIFPRPKLLHKGEAPPFTQAIASGTEGLDQMLNNSNAAYWLTDQRGGSQCSALQGGSTTLLVGPVGAGKTRLCVQFLRCREDAKADGKVLQTGGAPADTDELKGEFADPMAPEDSNIFVCLSPDAQAALKAGPGDKIAQLNFTQSHFEFNHLAAHLHWALYKFTGQRLAFDGLSEWLTLYERSEAAKMLEAVSIIIRYHPRFQQKKEDGKPPAGAVLPTVFMTYDMHADDDPLAPRALGVTAENVIALKQVNIQDEIRKVIYVIKSSHPQNDRSVRELSYVSEDTKVVVRSGLDNYNGLLRGEIVPAEVLLQLFRENDGQRMFNSWLKARLERLSNLRIRLLDFSRSEIGGLLENISSPTRFPSADLKIVSVDEWWLGALGHDPLKKCPPLLNLQAMLHAERSPAGPNRPPLATWNDFWLPELEKSGPNYSKPGEYRFPAERYAVPAYKDYGIFCIHADACLAKPASSLGRSKRLNPLAKEREHLKQLWEGAVNQYLGVPWVRRKTLGKGEVVWFEMKAEKKAPTLVEAALALKEKLGLRWGFAFDTSTRETAACFFFELAWAFGAEEHFLQSPPKDIEPDNPALTALKFLQFLVLEGLMPARSSVAATRESVFSRHFYSTLRSAEDLARWDEHDGKKDEEVTAAGVKDPPEIVPPPPYRRPRLIALPFMPLGWDEPQTNQERLKNDLAPGRQRALDRVAQLRPSERAVFLDAPKQIPAAGESALLELLNEMREKSAAGPGGNAAIADLVENARWHELRHRLLGGGPGNAVEYLRPPERPTPSAKPARRAESAEGPESNRPLLTGYCCSGSWMYGVHTGTRSASLANEILQEMTSLEASEERARRGAGIPPRRDFFELHGDEPVTGMEYLTWWELLRFCASRARRRESVYTGPNPAGLYETIQQELHACLLEAELHKPAYRSGGDSVREAIALQLSQMAESALKRIHDAARRKAKKGDA